MLTLILKKYLHPYRRSVAIVAALLFAQAMANLYLPNLNADLINNGVAKGDIHYILHIGAIMLASSA
jgi:ATP-binding cassette subfamily B protein